MLDTSVDYCIWISEKSFRIYLTYNHRITMKTVFPFKSDIFRSRHRLWDTSPAQTVTRYVQTVLFLQSTRVRALTTQTQNSKLKTQISKLKTQNSNTGVTM